MRTRLPLFGFGFVAPSLTHQCTDLFGRLVLCGQTFVQFVLDRLAAVVQFFDFGDYRSGVHSFFARRRMAASRSSLSCLIVSMVLKYYVFGEQNYKTNPNRKHICRLFLLFAPR